VSRIRSIHPGLWTDEAFVSLSPLARLLFIGMWNECDDKGCFPWSPLKLKMRVLPADNADAAVLLAEIEQAGMIRRYNFTGKDYGVVRNFCKHQRPKKPNDLYPAAAEILRFAGMEEELIADKAASVPNQSPTSGEISPQMEDGEEEGGGSSVSDDTGAVAPPSANDICKAIFDTGRAILMAADVPERQAGSILGRLRKNYSDSQVLVALSRCQIEQPSDPVAWLTKALQHEARHGNRPANDEPQNPYVRAAIEREAERAGAERR